MSKAIGKIGECMAQKYLKSKGFNILNNNYSSRYGEIDIVATKDECLVFVEVKFRKENSMVSGLESVDKRKQIKITKTALVYLSKFNKDVDTRFDVIEITDQNSEKVSAGSIIHIENAFCLEDYYLKAA